MREKDIFGVKTPTPEEVAEKHGVELQYILQELEKGIAIEKEHSLDERIAREIALDHLNEMPNYYEKIEEIESENAER